MKYRKMKQDYKKQEEERKCKLYRREETWERGRDVGDERREKKDGRKQWDGGKGRG